MKETACRMVVGKDKEGMPWPGFAEELEQLTGSTGTSSPQPRITPGPEHDAVTRWLIEATGELPTPEVVRQLRPAVEHLLERERHPMRDLARILLKDDPHTPPLDTAELGSMSAKLGGEFFTEINAEKLAKARRQTAQSTIDPKAAQMAYSSSVERKARVAASKRKKADAKLAATSAGTKKRSRVPGKNAPRSLDRDRSILSEIQGFLEAQVAVRLTPKKAEVVRPGSVSPLLPTSKRGRSTTHDPVIWLPNWEKASQPLRAMAMGIVCGEMGGLDFTLHLGDSGIEYARGVGEITFARRMYKRIKETLAKKDYRDLPEIDLMFFVEQGKGERPHLHGVVLPGTKLTPSKKALLRAAMREAGGTDWKPAGHDKTQAVLGSLYGPVGWIAYITKYTEITKAEIGDNLFAASRKITRMGREWYEETRKERLLLLPGKAVAMCPR